MENPKVLAYRYSQEEDGLRVRQDEVEFIDSKTENGVTTYIVRMSEGIYCTAIFNPFAGSFYVDDVYGVLENYQPNLNLEM